jgi:hypothetical protein
MIRRRTARDHSESTRPVELFGYDDNKAIEIVVITKVTGLMKVLFAEDDHKVGKHVKDALTAEGYATSRRRPGARG